MPNSDFLYSFVQTLNHVASKEPKAMQDLIRTRVKTDTDFADDDKIIVPSHNEISVLGIINSMINNYCGKKIVACIDDNDNLTRFKVG